MIDKLLPCPFCGGTARLLKGGPGNNFVRCDECSASSDDGSEERVIAAWNRRPASKAAAQADYERRIMSALAQTEEDRALANFDTFAAEHFASSRAALASEAVAWADPRAIEALQNKTAAGSVYLARERSDAYTCPLYTHPTPAPVGQLVEAARDVLASWDARMADGPEQLKPGSGIIPPYWSPHASMVDAEAMAKLRAALAGGAVGDGWRLVPVEPTEAMLLAAFHVAEDQLRNSFPNDHCKTNEERSAHAIRPLWSAMLAASPTGRE